MTLIYERLATLAKDKNLSLEQAAKEAGVPRRTLSNWRNRLPRTLEHYVRLLNFLQGRTRSTPSEDDNKPVREGGDKPA